MKDLLLIEAIIKNDKSAFEVFFKRYYGPLVNYIRTHTHDLQLAEDIVQQVFTNLWSDRHNIKIETSAKGYLYTVSYRAYIDYYRKAKQKKIFFGELKEKTLRNSISEDNELTNERVKRLKAIIETLPPRCKEILLLNKMTGLKYKEISEQLNISKKTVEAQMRVAYIKIREGFNDDNLIMFFLSDLFPHL